MTESTLQAPDDELVLHGRITTASNATFLGTLCSSSGDDVPVVYKPIRGERPLAQPLLDGHPYLRAEVAYAVTHEGALHVEDVLARRVRLLIESPDAGASAAPEVAAIMAGLLGWNRRRRAAELRRYLDFASANAAALSAPTVLSESVATEPVPA